MSKESKKQRAEALDKLVKIMDEAVTEKSPMSKMELSTEALMHEFAQKKMDEQLASLPPENDEPKKCMKCGRLVRVRARAVPRTFKSLVGTHTYKRNYHYCEDCMEGFYPRDEELGLPKDAAVTGEVAKKIADFGVNETYDFAAERWNFHYSHLPISTNQVRLVMERLGKMVESCDEAVLQTALLAPNNDDEDVVYIMNDGAMVPMRHGEWNEVKTGVIFREKNHVRGTEELRGFIRAPRYVSVLGQQEEFKKSLKKALQVETVSSCTRAIWVSDGAPGNWNMASLLCPKAVQILDFRHAIEHASNCGKMLFGENDACATLFREAISELLLAGDIKTCLRQLMQCVEFCESEIQLKAINDLVRYFRNNKKRMRYDWYLGNNWLIGSGVVESAHRHVIQNRMKRAGQHWGKTGGRRMARMRAAYRTAGAAQFFDGILAATAKSRLLEKSPKYQASLQKRRASNR